MVADIGSSLADTVSAIIDSDCRTTKESDGSQPPECKRGGSINAFFFERVCPHETSVTWFTC